ncbi:MAG TPA: biotin--[acetyl-CoA-carboxylase] ligase, partial [Flavobacteriales bacterium]|nr:biotin--[acetyl-CoA-carboxylase] ligase [Flavobacteriales bacterium]
MFGKPLLTFEALESSNKTAADLLSRGEVAHGAVILANEQSDGRGQRGSAWRSAPGLDLTFTIVVQPHGLRADAQFVLGKIAALAVSDVVRAHVPEGVKIKWPNDVLVERRKVAGILIKNDIVGELVLNSLIGIGFNVNSKDHDPDHVATSLTLETGRTFDRMAVL